MFPAKSVIPLASLVIEIFNFASDTVLLTVITKVFLSVVPSSTFSISNSSPWYTDVAFLTSVKLVAISSEKVTVITLSATTTFSFIVGATLSTELHPGTAAAAIVACSS